MYQGPPKINLAPTEDVKLAEAERLAQEAQDAEYAEMAAYYAEENTAQAKIEKLEAGPLIEEFEASIDSFKKEFPLEKLLEINEVSYFLSLKLEYADDLESPERIAKGIAFYEKNGTSGSTETYKKTIDTMQRIVLTESDQEVFDFKRAAKKALTPIVELFNNLKAKSNIDQGKLEELRIKKSELENAQGRLDSINYEIKHG